MCARGGGGGAAGRGAKVGNAPGAAAGGGGTRASSQQPGTMPASSSGKPTPRRSAGFAAAALSAASGGSTLPPAAARCRCTFVGAPHSNFSHARPTRRATVSAGRSSIAAKASSSKEVSLMRLIKAYCVRKRLEGGGGRRGVRVARGRPRTGSPRPPKGGGDEVDVRAREGWHAPTSRQVGARCGLGAREARRPVQKAGGGPRSSSLDAPDGHSTLDVFFLFFGSEWVRLGVFVRSYR